MIAMAPWALCILFCSGGVCIHKKLRRDPEADGRSEVEIVHSSAMPAAGQPVLTEAPVEAVVGVPVPHAQPVPVVSSTAVVISAADTPNT